MSLHYLRSRQNCYIPNALWKASKCTGSKCKYFLWSLWCKNLSAFELPHCSGHRDVCPMSNMTPGVLETGEVKSRLLFPQPRLHPVGPHSPCQARAVPACTVPTAHQITGSWCVGNTGSPRDRVNAHRLPALFVAQTWCFGWISNIQQPPISQNCECKE